MNNKRKCSSQEEGDSKRQKTNDHTDDVLEYGTLTTEDRAMGYISDPESFPLAADLPREIDRLYSEKSTRAFEHNLRMVTACSYHRYALDDFDRCTTEAAAVNDALDVAWSLPIQLIHLCQAYTVGINLSRMIDDYIIPDITAVLPTISDRLQRVDFTHRESREMDDERLRQITRYMSNTTRVRVYTSQLPFLLERLPFMCSVKIDIIDEGTLQQAMSHRVDRLHTVSLNFNQHQDRTQSALVIKFLSSAVNMTSLCISTWADNPVDWRADESRAPISVSIQKLRIMYYSGRAIDNEITNGLIRRLPSLCILIIREVRVTPDELANVVNICPQLTLIDTEHGTHVVKRNREHPLVLLDCRSQTRSVANQQTRDSPDVTIEPMTLRTSNRFLRNIAHWIRYAVWTATRRANQGTGLARYSTSIFDLMPIIMRLVDPKNAMSDLLYT